MDLVVFPEYALHGLSMDTVARDHVHARRPRGRGLQARPASTHRIWGCFSIMEANPGGNPYNSGLIIDDTGAHPPLLPQAAPVGAGRAVGARQPGHPGVRRPQRQQARAHHLPRRHAPRDGARGRVQGRRHHPAHRRLHRADPPRLEDHQPGQRLLQPRLHRERVHVRQRRQLRLDGRGHVLQLRRHGAGRGRRPRRRDHHLRAAARPRARSAHAAGAWRTTSTSSTTAATWR